ncbi:MAG: EamA family transporter [bacterium]
MTTSPQTKSILYSLAAVLLWSTVATTFKLTLEGMNFVQLLFYSSFFATIALFVIAMSTKRTIMRKQFSANYFTKNVLLGFLNPFFYYLVLFKAYSILPAQEAQPLNYTWPITISIFSVIFLKQKVSIKTIIGLLVAFIGVYVIACRGVVFPIHFQNPFGVLLAVGSSIIWAVFWTLNMIDERENSIKLFGSFYFGTIITAIYIIFFDSFHLSNYNYLLGALYIGLFEMGITFFLWMKGLQLSKNKTKTSTLAYLSPFISMLFISLILKEKILLSSLIGLVLIIGGILFQQLEGKFKKNKQQG